MTLEKAPLTSSRTLPGRKCLKPVLPYDVALLVTKDLATFSVYHCHVTVSVEGKQHYPSNVKILLRLLLLLHKKSLCGSLLGLIAKHQNYADNFAMFVPDRRCAVSYGALRAVLGDEYRVVRQTHNESFAQDLTHRVFDRLPSLFVEDAEHLLQWLAAGFLLPPAGEGLCDRVKQIPPARQCPWR